MASTMRALREQLSFPVRTPANIESVLNHLRTPSFSRQFRQGDVSMERWDCLHSNGERLNQALEICNGPLKTCSGRNFERKTT
jgi:pilus assembly protein CpaC